MWKVHKRNFYYLLACAGAVLAAVFLILLPNERLLVSQAVQIETLTEEIAREKVLLPIYKSLEKENEAFRPALLPNPKKEILDRLEADKITLLIADTSRKSNLKLISSVPDINSLSKNGKFLSVSMKLLGEFLDLRRFLTRLGEIPYIWYTEKIQVKSIPGARELNLTVWFAIETSGVEEKEPEAENKKI